MMVHDDTRTAAMTVSDILSPKCYDCGRPYGDEHGFPDLVIPHDVWQEISPDKQGNGLLCPSCICKRAHKAGFKNVAASFRSGPFCVHD